MGGAGTANRSLSQRIVAGDADAFAGFRDAHVEKVRVYCEVACPRELCAEATSAALLEFLARLRNLADHNLEEVLLQATRVAAAGHFAVESPPNGAQGGAGERAPDPTCLAMPELLAAAVNDELKHDSRLIQRHLEDCPTCELTVDRMERAEHRYAQTCGWETRLEAVPDRPEAVPDRPEAVPDRPEASPAGAVEPGYEAAPVPPVRADEPPGPPPVPAQRVVKVRRGGIIGGVRRFVRSPRTPGSPPY